MIGPCGQSTSHFFSYEPEFSNKLARKFDLSYRYTDDLISFNNTRFKEFSSDIYPKELTISETKESTSIVSYLDLLFIQDSVKMILIFDGFADGQLIKLAKMAVSCMRQMMLTLSRVPGDCID